jgi:hypothetical protein
MQFDLPVHHAVLSSDPTPLEQVQILFETALNQKKIQINGMKITVS